MHDVFKPTLRHPNGASYYFDEHYVQSMIVEWQLTQDIGLLDNILRACTPAIQRVIFGRRTAIYEEESELLSRVHQVLFRRALRQYNPERESAFTFINVVTNSVLVDVVRRAKTHNNRHRSIDAKHDIQHENGCLDGEHSESPWLKDHQTDPFKTSHAMEDIEHKIQNIRTICREPREQEAQRWLIKGLLAEGFDHPRHRFANVIQLVYNISHERSRQLYDYSVLEIRRQLMGERNIKPVRVAELVGTKHRALAKYEPQLGPQRFAVLFHLMRNLAPSLITEFGMDRIRNGFPEAVPLFTRS